MHKATSTQLYITPDHACIAVAASLMLNRTADSQAHA